MSYKIVYTPEFEKEIKRLSSKYPSLRSDFYSFLQVLSENPFQGVPLGNQCYKVRMAIKSKGKGKSGRFKNHYLRSGIKGNSYTY